MRWRSGRTGACAPWTSAILRSSAVSRDSQATIRTVRGYGYQLVLPVHVIENPVQKNRSNIATPPPLAAEPVADASARRSAHDHPQCIEHVWMIRLKLQNLAEKRLRLRQISRRLMLAGEANRILERHAGHCA